MKPKIIKGLPNEDYHRGEGYKDYISSTGIRRFLKSPSKFRYAKEEETVQMRFGTAYHSLILEGITDIIPIYKSAAAQKDAVKRLFEMREVLGSNKTAMKLLTAGEQEVSMFWEESGLKFKCRADNLTPNKIIVDLKTAKDASYYGFRSSVKAYGYDVQDVMYRRGVKAAYDLEMLPSFVFVVQEKEPDYEVGIYELSDSMIWKASAKLDEAIAGLQVCFETGEWGGYKDEIVTIYDD